MKKRDLVLNALLLLVILGVTPWLWAETVLLEDLPPLPPETFLTAAEQRFGFRGRIGGFKLPPSRYGAFRDPAAFYPGGEDQKSIKYMYDRKAKS